jgi:hypothetical protein
VSSTRPAWISADVINNPGGAESICYEFNRYMIAEDEELGDALYDAKYYCYQYYGWDHYAEHINQCNFNLYGDPAMVRTGIGTAVASKDAPPAQDARLLQNYPNPFNPYTRIVYILGVEGHVILEVFNVVGHKVTTLVNEHQRSGRKAMRWDGRNMRGDALPSGVYFYRLSAGDYTDTRKMILLR